MKKTYHLCLSAGDEVMFRHLEDYHRGFNCFACALYKTGSTGLVDSIMSTHAHWLAQTTDPGWLMYEFLQPYSMYFNNRQDWTTCRKTAILARSGRIPSHDSSSKLHLTQCLASWGRPYPIRLPALFCKCHIPQGNGEIPLRDAA